MNDIKFEYKLKKNKHISTRTGVTYIKIDKSNYILHSDLINKSIQLFNSEIQWDSMWIFEDAKQRFDDNNIMYIMIEDNSPLGYVWYDKNHLYNTFVTKKRIKGDSQNFINYTLHDLITKHTTIHCECNDWNIKAQKFFKGIGFNKIKT